MESHPQFKVLDNEVRARNDHGELEGIVNDVNTLASLVDKLEPHVQQVERFYSNNRKKQLKKSKSNLLRDKDRGRRVASCHYQQDGKSAAERMQDLMRQFGVMMNKITQALDPQDVDDLRLHDSSQSAIGKPRDFNSIRERMEAKDGSGYKHVRDIYHDVRSILNDSIKYNDVRSTAHVTAKTLMDKFAQKWILLYPQIVQEDERIEEEEGVKQDYHAKLAESLIVDLNKADMCLNKLREMVLQRRRKMSVQEKIELGRALTNLSAKDLMRALEIVAEENPTFQATGEELDLDINAQSESTLWRLHYFIAGVFKAKAQGNQTRIGGDRNIVKKANTPANPSRPKKPNLKRNKETLGNSGKPPLKKSKKVGPTV